MNEEDESRIGFKAYTYKGIPIEPAPQWYIDMLRGQMTINPKKDIPIIGPDPDFCGLGDINTGPNDPWYKRACIPHDRAYEDLKQGEWPVFGEFAKNIAKGMLDGAIMLLTGPLYLLVGGLGGVIRYQQLKLRKNPKPEETNLGDEM